MQTQRSARVTKRFTVNMGNYESYALEVSTEVIIGDEETTDQAFARAHKYTNDAAYADLNEAARVSDVRNTYVLTWLKKRDEEKNAERTDENQA